jgi:hypothetical protein
VLQQCIKAIKTALIPTVVRHAGRHQVQIKTSISISSFIKLRLGDTLRLVVYHNWRHLIQAKNACN